MSITFPFTPISGQGLGTCYSSLEQIGMLNELQGLGQAKIVFFPNIANGNLIIKDHMISVIEAGTPLQLGYVYNSQATDVTKCWKFSATKYLKVLPSVGQPAKAAVLVESDGHETSYTSTEGSLNYYAPAINENGKSYLYYDSVNTQWLIYNPGDHSIEYYGSDGLLKKRTDMYGNMTIFQYVNGQLNAIVGPSGARYELYQSNNSISLSLVEGTEQIILAVYQFDNLGRLLSTTLNPSSATPYITSYQYYANLPFITQINQTDGTQAQFSYQINGSQRKIQTIRYGASNVTRITYETNNQVSIEDAQRNLTQIALNADGQIITLRQQVGDVSEATLGIDETNYLYQQGQLIQIIHPDGGKESFSYDNYYQLLTQKTKANNQCADYYYPVGGTGPEQDKVISKVNYVNGQALVSYFVYDPNYNGHGNYFLRYQISPKGCVTEYRPDRNGNIASQRTYLVNIFDTSIYQPNHAFSLATIQRWVDLQDPQKINLIDYAYDQRGQRYLIKSYTDIDSYGNGITNAGMSYEEINRDEFGSWFERQTWQTETDIVIARQTSDFLQRITSQTNELAQVTQYQFNDLANQSALANKQIIFPNGRTGLQNIQADGNYSGLTESVTLSDGTVQQRSTFYRRDFASRVIVTQAPDGNNTYQFYDAQNRLIYRVNASGQVREYRTDRLNRFTMTIDYAVTINLSDLDPTPNYGVPNADHLNNLLDPLREDTENRFSYEFFDASWRSCYQVDAEQYVQQIFYDTADRKIREINYANKLDNDLFNQLKQGKTISIDFDATRDRTISYFYDSDSVLIGQQDAAGYVTEYKCDLLGQTIEKIVYQQATLVNADPIQNFAAVKPADDQNDAHTYWVHDTRGQIIAEVDAENYLTTKSYSASGLLLASVRYANRIDLSQWLDKTQIPPLPIASTEDRRSLYQYDALSRLVENDVSSSAIENDTATSQKALITQYEIMGHIALKRVQDLTDPYNASSDAIRGSEFQYDDWEQVIAETNPYVATKLAEIDLNQTLTPAEKIIARSEIWQTISIRHQFDPVSGLKLSSLDPLGNRSIYYYDLNQQLILSIDGSGAIIELVRNNFNEITIKRAYLQRLTNTHLQNMQGGYLTPDVRNLINSLQDSKDPITEYQFDKRSLVSRVTDPEGYISLQEFNAFRELSVTQLPLADKQPSIIVTQQYEPRGLAIKISRAANDGSIAVSTEKFYQNSQGQCTQTIDELGNATQFQYDKLARQTVVNDSLNNSSKRIYDAFDRVTSEINPLNQVTNHEFNQLSRTEIIKYPVENTQTIQKTNIFGEIISSNDSLGNTKQFIYGSAGEVVTTVDALNRISQIELDLNGNKIAQIDANQIKASFLYNSANQLIQKTEDVTGLSLTTHYFPDALGRDTAQIDPRGVRREQGYDRCNNVLHVVSDPQQLNLLTHFSCNGQNKVVDLTQGNATNSAQYEKKDIYDKLNRKIATSIDPNGLNLITQQHLNAAGISIAEVDPNGHITRKFYDSVNQLRFVIDPLGGVIAWNYDAIGNKQYERRYQQKIDVTQINLNDLTTLADIVAQLQNQADPLDTVIWYFYDNNQREKFQVNCLGAVTEKVYNDASWIIESVAYAKLIDISQIEQLTIDQLADIVSQNIHPDDRHLYYVYDANHNERFRFIPDTDGNSIVTEQVFDNLNRIIAKTTYATLINHAANWASLSIDQITAQLVKNPQQDQTNFTIYDALGRIRYEVNGEAAVTYYERDANGNPTAICQFAEVITIPDNYLELVELLNSLTPNQSRGDRITIKRYDAANRLIESIDALGNKEIYQLDALGNIISKTDRAGNVWQEQFDRANRSILQLTPPVPVSLVEMDPINTGKLIQTSAMQSIQTHITYDAADNKLAIATAVGTSEERLFQRNYDACNNPIGSIIPNVAIDDVTKMASLTTRPETVVTITTQIKNNAKGLKIAEQRASGQWHFYIYDALNQLNYVIDSLGYVTQRNRNAFGEVIKKIRYATPVKLVLSRYTETGVPLNVLLNALHISSDDRIKLVTRNSRGKVSEIQYDAQLYYLPNNTQPYVGYATPITRRLYDAFNNCISEARLLNPQTNSWATKIRWFNRANRLLASCDELQHIIRYQQNAFNEISKRQEFANVPKIALSPAVTIENLDLAMQSVSEPTDRIYDFTRDNLGQVIVQTLTGNVAVQELLMDATGIPGLKNLSVTSLSKQYVYSPTQLLIATTDEAGNTIHKWYCARGLKIAETGVPRQSQDENHNPITLIPLTTYGYSCVVNNNSPQAVVTTRYKQGTTLDAINSFEPPKPINPDPEDQQQLILLNNCTLPIMQQDAEQLTQYFTYTATQQIARKWGQYNQWQPNAAAIIHIDEVRMQYDQLERATQEIVLRDNTIVQTTQSYLDGFNQIVAEDWGSGTKPVFARFDKNGNNWITNRKDGITTILFTDLLGNNTLILRAANDDLSKQSYDQLVNLLSWDFKRLAQIETTVDMKGRVQTVKQPIFEQTNIVAAQNLPLSMHCVTTNLATTWLNDHDAENSSVTVSWVLPQESNIFPKLILWPIADPDLVIELPVSLINDRCSIDLSGYATDVYGYHISHCLMDPSASEPSTTVLYQTQGSFQIDSGNSVGSKSLVAIMQTDTMLRLTGNTQSLTGVELWADEQYIETIAVTIDPATHLGLVDLSHCISGNYIVKPVIAGQTLNKASLPFAVHSLTPSAGTFSRELNASLNLLTLDSHAQFIWDVPEAFAQYSVIFTCDYIATDDTSQTHTDTIAPGTILEKYRDANGKELDCNTEFAYSIKTINSINVSLVLDETNSIPLAITITPIIPENIEDDITPTCCETATAAIKNTTHNVINSVSRCLYTTVKTLQECPSSEQKKYVAAKESLELVARQPQLSKLTFIQDSDNVIVDNQFFPITLVLLTQLAAAPNVTTINYLDTSEDRLATVKQLPINGVLDAASLFKLPVETTVPTVVVDVSNIPAGNYPFTIDGANEWLVDDDDAVFTVNNQGLVYTSNLIPARAPAQLRCVHQRQYDAWNNIVVEIDSLGHQTHKIYNCFDKLVKLIQPNVAVTHADGNTVRITPTTSWGYNATGSIIGVCDAKGHTTGYLLDAANQKLGEILADGTLRSRDDYDALSAIIRHYDASNNCEVRFNDRNGLLIKRISPMGRQYLYDYDSQSRLASSTDPAGNITHYNHDNFGNTIETFLPSNEYSTAGFDRNRQPLYNTDRNGTRSWRRDPFGYQLEHWAGGAHSTFAYDNKKQLIWQGCDNVNRGQTTQQIIVKLDPDKAAAANLPYPANQNQAIDYYAYKAIPMPAQALQYIYSGDVLVEVYDHAQNLRTDLGYDSEMRNLNTSYWNLQTGALIRQVRTEVDELGRDISQFDTMMLLKRGYDEVGNNRYIFAYLYPPPIRSRIPNWPPQPQPQYRWYDYDAANRVTINAGVLVNGRVSLTAGQGLGLSYTNDLRTGELNYDKQNNPYISNLKYDADRNMIGTVRNDTSRTQRLYNLAGFNYHYSHFLPGHAEPDIQHFMAPNVNNWIYKDDQAGPDYHTVTFYDNFTADGQPGYQEIQYAVDAPPKKRFHDSLTIDYIPQDKLALQKIGGQRHSDDGRGPYDSITVFYDVNGYKKAILGVKTGPSDSPSISVLTLTHDGLIIKKSSQQASNNVDRAYNMLTTSNYKVKEEYYFYNRAGVPMGSYRPPSNYPEALAFIVLDYVQPVLDTYPVPMPPYVVVQPGDTYASIASRFCGDANWASAIAIYNRGSADDTFDAGQTIYLPQNINNTSNSSSAVSSSALDDNIFGNLIPKLDFADPSGGFSFGFIVELVVSIAIAVVAPYAGAFFANTAMGTSLSGALSSVLGNAAVGATKALAATVFATAADMNAQVLMTKLGFQDHFSLSQAIQVGVAAGVATGMGSKIDFSNMSWEGFRTAIVQAGKVAVTNQLTAMSLGLSKRFDFKAVIIDMAANMVGSKFDAQIPNPDINAAVNSLATNAFRGIISGKFPNIEELAAEAIGAAIGDQAAQLWQGDQSTIKQDRDWLNAPTGLQADTDTQLPAIDIQPPNSAWDRARENQAQQATTSKIKTAAIKYTKATPAHDLSSIYQPTAIDAFLPDYLRAPQSGIFRLDPIAAEMVARGNGLAQSDKQYNFYKTRLYDLYNPDEVRVKGASQLLGGTVELAAGAGMTRSGNGTGALLMLQGADQIKNGLKMMWTGKESSTYLSQILQAMYLTKDTADIIDTTLASTAGGVGIAVKGASVAKVGMFGRSISAAAESRNLVVNYAAHNAADAWRLKTILALQEANVLDLEGKLTQSAIKESYPALRPDIILKNPSVIAALTADGSNIAAWDKLTTQSIEMPTGQRIQVHFYKNQITGEINYTHPDFKVKGIVDIFSNKPDMASRIQPTYN